MSKIDFQVTDIKALYAAHPQFVKLVEDKAKIRKALELGLSLPGVEPVQASAAEPAKTAPGEAEAAAKPEGELQLPEFLVRNEKLAGA